MLTIDIINLTKKRVVLKELIKVSEYVASYLKLTGELSLVLTSDRRMKVLNRDFRGKDKVTDVLTFPAPDFSLDFLGEIFINLDDCRRAEKYQEIFPFSPSFQYLLFFLLIHGLLHLAGYSDEEEGARVIMVKKGKGIMKLLLKNAIIKKNH